MADDASKVSPPYITKSVFDKFINDLSETTMPERIDRSMFGNMNGGLAYSIISAAKFLKLTNPDGTPTMQLHRLRDTPTEARGPELEKMLKGAYPTLWAPGFNLKAATASQFNDHLRDQFGISGSTIDKAANFFMAIADQAGVEVSPHIKRRTPVAGSSASRKSPNDRKAAKAAKAADLAAIAKIFEDPPPPKPSASPVDVLMSIMDMEAMDDEEQEAVWKLVKYLKRLESASRAKPSV